MERFLLLWDELDELASATRHLAVGLRADLVGAGREALGRLGGLLRGPKPR